MYVSAKKGGKCRNAAHRDAGVISHYVQPMPPTCGGYWGDKALCGTIPGHRVGYGWTESDKEVNCPKCIKKFGAITPSV